MARVFYSGLDWSADPNGPNLVLTLVFVDGAELGLLENALAAARVRLGWQPDDAFKHTDIVSDTRAHAEFYSAIKKVPSLQARAYACDRSQWVLRHVKARRGDPCVCDGIATLALGCPNYLVADQIMDIDMPRSELPVIEAYRTALRHSMRGASRRSFGKISPRPDSRLNSGVVQAADTIAGEIREHAGLDGPHLPALGARVRMV